MSFTAAQIDALKAPLDRNAVKERKQGNSSVSYVEAYHAENEANRIFGFDAWDRETDLTLIGESLGKDKYVNGVKDNLSIFRRRLFARLEAPLRDPANHADSSSDEKPEDDRANEGAGDRGP